MAHDAVFQNGPATDLSGLKAPKTRFITFYPTQKFQRTNLLFFNA